MKPLGQINDADFYFEGVHIIYTQQWTSILGRKMITLIGYDKNGEGYSKNIKLKHLEGLI